MVSHPNSEVNFDAIPGPTHNYSGLSFGNLAAERHADLVSNPRQAALQGLAKMRALAARGYAQAVLPPHERPALWALRDLGFDGDDAAVVKRAASDAPRLLAACSSAAAMWAANAATVSPSADTADGRVHFTPANLAANYHRTLEAATTARVLRAIFCRRRTLRRARSAAVRRAARRRRRGEPHALRRCRRRPRRRALRLRTPRVRRRHRARSLSGAADVRSVGGDRARHGLDPSRTLFAQQNPAAIDAGVVPQRRHRRRQRRACCSATSRRTSIRPQVLARLRAAIGGTFTPIVVPAAEVSLDDSVSSYLFNSQLLALEDGRFLLVAPAEVRESPRVNAYVETLLASGGPIAEVSTFDLRQSMRNGGGPACLRLRVPLCANERAAISARVFLDDMLADELDAWIRRHYRDRLSPADLADPSLVDESRRALDELTRILALPSVYPFQL